MVPTIAIAHTFCASRDTWVVLTNAGIFLRGLKLYRPLCIENFFSKRRCKLICDVAGIEPIPLHCSVMGQSVTTSPVFQSQ